MRAAQIVEKKEKSILSHRGGSIFTMMFTDKGMNARSESGMNGSLCS